LSIPDTKETLTARRNRRGTGNHIDGADHAVIAEIVVISDIKDPDLMITGRVAGMIRGNKTLTYGFKRGKIGQLVGAHHHRPTQFK
jgi:hypothetical protein